MTASSPSPPLAGFLRELSTKVWLNFAEVRISARDGGYEFRHVVDASRRAEDLRPISLSDLRALAQTTALGAFRPIKTAPNLRSGWSCWLADAEELAAALEALYPGALSDWWAATQPGPLPVQNYREFTARQTGMYRITQQLTDAEVAAVIRAGCDAQLCLRRRLWTVAGLMPDDPMAGKSVIPCLEICPLMLEFARRSRRLAQAEPVAVTLVSEELVTVVQVLEVALAHPAPDVREGDLAHPANPRRIRLLRDRLQGLLPAGASVVTEV